MWSHFLKVSILNSSVIVIILLMSWLLIWPLLSDHIKRLLLYLNPFRVRFNLRQIIWIHLLASQCLRNSRQCEDNNYIYKFYHCLQLLLFYWISAQVYSNAPNTVHLSGLSNDRILHLTKEGLSDFVVWWDQQFCYKLF